MGWLGVRVSLEDPRIYRVALLLGVGLPAVLFAARMTRRLTEKRYSPQVSALLQKGVFYAGLILILVSILADFNFKLGTFLGAAGIFGVAIGFASQTSLSNIISGIFLISEKPFVIGDLISVGSSTGVVISVDLLSVKLRTLDNRMVRIPNENLVKTEIVNVTRFPIRRMDIDVGVAYKEDVSKVREVLLDIARKNPLVLDEPEPLILFKSFGDSALEFLFGVWFSSTDFLKVKHSIMQEIKERFDQEGIEIPFPHRTIYTGAVTDPFPVRVVGPGEGAPAGE
ncbi:mechanosensitive ion channel family protein [bacterium]|nr:mechanosensitive ion channel family protein [bacterium]